MSEQETRVRALLFERLVDYDHRDRSEPKPKRTLNRDELRESVRRELGRLFNTRSSVPAEHFCGEELTTIHYGIPDILGFAPWDAEDRRRLGNILVKGIEAFEPRLKSVKIVVETILGNPKALRARLDAVLSTESIREPVSFDTILEDRAGDWEFHCNL